MTDTQKGCMPASLIFLMYIEQQRCPGTKWRTEVEAVTKARSAVTDGIFTEEFLLVLLVLDLFDTLH